MTQIFGTPKASYHRFSTFAEYLRFAFFGALRWVQGDRSYSAFPVPSSFIVPRLFNRYVVSRRSLRHVRRRCERASLFFLPPPLQRRAPARNCSVHCNAVDTCTDGALVAGLPWPWHGAAQTAPVAAVASYS